jgi:hypothetical protein
MSRILEGSTPETSAETSKAKLKVALKVRDLLKVDLIERSNSARAR